MDGRDPLNAWLIGNAGNCVDLMTLLLTTLHRNHDMLLFPPDANGEDGGFQKPGVGAERSALLQRSDSGRFDVERFMLKEDWIFDAARGVMEVRIIGFAPMVIVRGTDGEVSGHRTLFWLHYPGWRSILATRPAPFQGEVPLSFGTMFDRRMFRSTLVKVNNTHDRMTNTHGTGLEALLESEVLRNQLVHMGFDLWHY